ncbi:VENOM COMPONENT: C-type lectin-snaclec-subunit-alpha 2 like [Crotalus adamanteus]|uniref:VENOM COMPONENT: C-type lectin-snaclec-subunit-alpha 2 like n=1 Tax=Crotalus adamanteus TaxID=8729 RepID=A0AAW1BEV4_CROAD
MGRFIFVSFGLLVVFLSLSGTGADLKCPPTWSSTRQYCYRPFKQAMTWDDAERFCTEQAKDGHLVSMETSLEASFVHIVLSENAKYLTHYVWIGLRVQNKGQPCSSISYENLVDPFQCFMASSRTSHREWLKVDCEQQHSFMCKFTRPR